MVVAKPLKKEAKVDIAALINKGGSVAGEKVIPPKEDEKMLLVIPATVAARLHTALKAKEERTGVKKAYKTPYIIEALVEKLEREENNLK